MADYYPFDFHRRGPPRSTPDPFPSLLPHETIHPDEEEDPPVRPPLEVLARIPRFRTFGAHQCSPHTHADLLSERDTSDPEGGKLPCSRDACRRQGHGQERLLLHPPTNLHALPCGHRLCRRCLHDKVDFVRRAVEVHRDVLRVRAEQIAVLGGKGACEGYHPSLLSDSDDDDLFPSSSFSSHPSEQQPSQPPTRRRRRLARLFTKDVLAPAGLTCCGRDMQLGLHAPCMDDCGKFISRDLKAFTTAGGRGPGAAALRPVLRQLAVSVGDAGPERHVSPAAGRGGRVGFGERAAVVSVAYQGREDDGAGEVGWRPRLSVGRWRRPAAGAEISCVMQ